jgi:hypothetical protein
MAFDPDQPTKPAIIRGGVAVLLSVMLAACTTPAASQGGPTGQPGSGPTSATASGGALGSAQIDPALASQAFGGTVPNDGSITYQPDVAVVGGGGAMVRDVSDDGLTWTIAPDAPGIADATVGRVMLLSGMAAGRVLKRDDTPNGVAVVLGPVDLTDVIRNGHFEGEAALHLDADPIVAFADQPGAVTELPTSDTGSLRPELASFHQPQWVEPATAGVGLSNGSVKGTVGPFSAKLKDGAVEVGYSENGLEFIINFGPKSGPEPTRYSFDIQDGKPTNGFLSLDWLKGLKMKMSAGSTSGLGGNIKYRIEMPFTEVIPIDPPIQANVKFKFLVESVFTAKTSTLSDEAEYDFTAPPGWTIAKGDLTLNSLQIAATVPALQDLDGVSIGVNGFVFAFQINTILGLGTPLFTAGPYVSATISYAVTVGSDAGLSGVKCHQATTKIVLDGGVGYRLTDAAVGGPISKALSGLGIDLEKNKVKLESEWPTKSSTLFNQATWSPDLKICSLSDSP